MSFVCKFSQTIGTSFEDWARVFHSRLAGCGWEAGEGGARGKQDVGLLSFMRRSIWCGGSMNYGD